MLSLSSRQLSLSTVSYTHLDVYKRQAEPGVRFRDDVLGEEPVRVAYLWLAGTGGAPDADNDALVQVAETLGKRSQLATEIIKGCLLYTSRCV